jgi:hypothetical protein
MSLFVPYSRLENEQKSFTIGKSTEITRDEIKFAKFISRLRNKFSELFYNVLKTQLILKKIITPDDWEEIKDKIYFDYLKDNYFSELKENELTLERANVLNLLQPYIGKFYSEEWVKKNILGQNEIEIEAMQQQMEKEKKEMEKEMAANLPPGGDEMNGDMPPNGDNPQQPPFPPKGSPSPILQGQNKNNQQLKAIKNISSSPSANNQQAASASLAMKAKKTSQGQGDRL